MLKDMTVLEATKFVKTMDRKLLLLQHQVVKVYGHYFAIVVVVVEEAM
jgi:hypothetical protein